MAEIAKLDGTMTYYTATEEALAGYLAIRPDFDAQEKRSDDNRPTKPPPRTSRLSRTSPPQCPLQTVTSSWPTTRHRATPLS